MATTTDRDRYRPRIMFVCDREVADLLQQWANQENRTRSNLTETLVKEAIQHRLSKSIESATPTKCG
ncbi:hypothetical protein WA1_51640 [Scytonema hofmannii PCC 7110]|uniref:CopG-like ribbon-helix-helix domain-containing protein n=1 Tax=Scytonema hofmannii PCC 7110 TaxID=128403 RepID=A0A139WQ05_9CYAN|nr:hypothetical protein [Scytonema hofmannii]KYC34498.1 hypothetical protein WA1_51640 [Scytonema hofmannii PCC 7110]